MTTYHPAAIARAVLADQLNAMEDLMDRDITDVATAAGVPCPDRLPGDDQAWDHQAWADIYTAIDDLTAQVRQHVGIPEPKEEP